ncbi:hypothetical protein GTW98_32495 [Streptomyces sp. SID8375]|uniref:hypothetical protein n=1 Tax=Streptomyces TaxID=1883 RepID=UPI000475F067|nr:MULTISPECIES: hypothetical protein [unclassified Streptomyces]MYT18684.1 hypothetical protein [Streptomyces sp. SID4951]MYX11455.1 hypothetical protein [Streptomyces sp. SID8375]SCK60346.1 hypothetical protein YWIDRAFT_08434 [Streptomyces sp. SceaMP-e96]
MPEPSPPPELPVRLLTDPEMIKACRLRDFALVFRMVKKHAGIYPSVIARRCDLTPSRVGEVMAAKRKLLHMDVVERISDGLRIPGHMLGLSSRTWESPPERSAVDRESPLRPAEPSASSSTPTRDVDNVLASIACTSPSASTVQALRSSIEDYWRRDDEHGGEALRPAVIGQLRYVESLLTQSRGESVRHGLLGVAAELARLTGWTHFDSRQFSQARLYFGQALRFAKDIDDRQFMANVLACMSLQATYQDRPTDALALATAAQDHARAISGTPRVLSMLSMREAFAHATLGSRSGAHAAISEAHRQFERISDSDSDPLWVTYFNNYKLAVDTGIAHARLGEAEIAEPLIAQVLHHESSTNQRGRAFHAFWLARTQLQQGKLEQACHTAVNALTPASAVTSERVTGHLREFSVQLSPHRAEPAALAFDSQLRQVLPVGVSGSPRP